MPDAHPADAEPAHELDDALSSVEGQQSMSTPRYPLQLTALPHNRLQIATIGRSQVIRSRFAAFHLPGSFLGERA